MIDPGRTSDPEAPVGQSSLGPQQWRGLGFGLAGGASLLLSLATAERPGAIALCAVAWVASLLLAVLAVWPTGEPSRGWGRTLGRLRAALRTREAAVMAALTLLGAGLRLYDLAGYPTGLNGDEAEFALLALDVLHGHGPYPFGTAFLGDSALYLYFQAPFLAVFGPTVAGIRVFGALAGVLTLPAFYLFMRRLFGRRPALLALALLAGSAAHVNFSRLALNVPQVPLLACLALYALWRALESRLAVWWLASGMLGAFAVYFHFGGRLLPLIVALYFVYLLVWHRRQWRAWLRGVAYCLLGGMLTLAPLGAYAARHPEDLIYHVNARLIFNIWPQVTATYGTDNLLAILGQQFALNVLGFVSVPDGTNLFYRFAETPLLAPLLAPFFLAGLALVLWRLRDGRYGLLVAWFWTFILVGTVTNEPPQSHRLVTVLPPAIAGIALVLDALIAWAQRWRRPAVGRAVVSLALLVPLAAGAADNANYFGPAAAARPWEEVTLLGTYVSDLGPSYRVYVLGAPSVYYWHGDRRFLAPDVPGGDLDKPTPGELAALPRDRALVFLVYPWLEGTLPLIQQVYPDGRVEPVSGQAGRTVFTAYFVPPGPAAN
ncbi:MAG: glycosyltransferase family 39 protein [Chloroflexi bacterium]|nr:glycosyltransferase family 39 protein [Chloroflexota bacterium]